MKRIVLSLLASYSLCLQGQTIGDVGKIALSVIMPDNNADLQESNSHKLEAKIIQIVASCGIAANGFTNNFIMYPKFSVYDEKVVEGGMQNLTYVNCEISLYVKQQENELIYGAYSARLMGSGTSKKEAVSDAISKISVHDQHLVSFIDETKRKIISYYESRCQDIIQKSEALVRMHQFQEAIGLLMNVPEQVSSCYSKVQNKSVEAYKSMQNLICSEQLQRARTTCQANHFKEALEILAQIDPSTACFKEAQSLAMTAAQQIDAAARQQWEFRMKVYRDKIEMDKFRINAVKEVALAYYRNRPKVINNIFLIK